MWIWILLTAPTTLVGLYVYARMMRQTRQNLGLSKDEEPRVNS